MIKDHLHFQRLLFSLILDIKYFLNLYSLMMTGVILTILMFLNQIYIMEENHIQKMEMIHSKIFTSHLRAQLESKNMPST
jgi:hypothetical protein